jgi:hypothetical protein
VQVAPPHAKHNWTGAIIGGVLLAIGIGTVVAAALSG